MAEECIRLAERAGFMPPLIQTRTELAFIYGILGAFQRAFELAELTLAAAKGQSFLGMAGPTLPLAVVAYLHALDGNLAESEVLLAEAQSGFDASGAVTGASFFINLADGQLALMRGDYARIVAEADAAIPMLRQTGIRLYFPDVLYLKGKALLGMSRTDEAWQTLNEARAEAEAIGSRRTLWPILIALSDIEAQRGNLAQAQSLHQQARQIVEFIADHAGSPELRASFLDSPDVRAVMSDE